LGKQFGYEERERVVKINKSIFGRKMWTVYTYLGRWTGIGRSMMSSVAQALLYGTPLNITSCLVTAVICESEKIAVLKGCKCGHAAVGHVAQARHSCQKPAIMLCDWPFGAALDLVFSRDYGTYALRSLERTFLKASSLSIGGAGACDLFVKRSQIESRRESQTRVAFKPTSRKKKRGLHVEPMRFLGRDYTASDDLHTPQERWRLR
jgi:hypothetical protein